MEHKTKWSIDPIHSEIAFKVRHLMIANIKGAFSVFNATVYTDGKDFTTAEIDLCIDVTSIHTGDKKRDEHLKGADFFDVKNHKQIKFISNNVQRTDAKDNFELHGMLTIKGFSQEVVLNVKFGGIAEDVLGNEKAGFIVTGEINKIAWGLGWNQHLPSGRLMLSETVNITCDVELINASQQEAVNELAFISS